MCKIDRYNCACSAEESIVSYVTSLRKPVKILATRLCVKSHCSAGSTPHKLLWHLIM